MIIEALLDWLFGLVDWMISLIPDTNPPEQAMDFGWLADINYFLPVGEMFALFVIFFAMGGPLAGVSMVIWVVVGIIRGGSTKA